MKLKNISKQALPVLITITKAVNGKNKNFIQEKFVVSGGSVESSTATPCINNLLKKKLLKVV